MVAALRIDHKGSRWTEELMVACVSIQEGDSLAWSGGWILAVVGKMFGSAFEGRARRTSQGSRNTL